MASVDQAEILRCYEERTRAFVVDDSEEELGAPQERETGLDRIKIAQQELAGLSIIASLTRVQYGYWASPSRAACLMAMRVQFQKGNATILRFKKVDLMVEFNARPKGEARADPAVLDYGPKKLQARETPEDRTWHYSVTLSAKATVGPVELGPGAEAGKRGQYTRYHAATIEADDYGDRLHESNNCVKVWLSEDEKQKNGIPLELRMAVIVTCPGPMQATVAIRADTLFHLLARPWSAKDPIPLQPGVEKGDKLPGGRVDFATLTPDDWRQMVTSDLEYRLVAHRRALDKEKRRYCAKIPSIFHLNLRPRINDKA